jgi:hypothetical protein
MDLVIDYRGEQSVCELKIRRGNAYGVKEIRSGDMTLIEAVV